MAIVFGDKYNLLVANIDLVENAACYKLYAIVANSNLWQVKIYPKSYIIRSKTKFPTKIFCNGLSVATL